VRRGLRLYGAGPTGYPGNDDLGTLSSWYVFGALGLFPSMPGVGLLAIGSPLFHRASVALPHHRRLTITTRGRGVYVDALKLNGHGYGKPWASWCSLARGAHLAFSLSSRPDRRWGSSVAAQPPSYGPARPMPGNACAP